MISAKEAKAIADLVDLRKYEEQTTELSKELLMYAVNGHYNLVIHLPLIDSVIEALKINGYNVERMSADSFRIYW